VAVLWGPPNDPNPKNTEAAARSLGLGLQSLEVRGPEDLEGAFRAAAKERAHALVVLRNPAIFNQLKRIAELAIKSRLPAIYDDREFVEAGGSPRRAADEVRTGDKPQDGEADRADDSAECADESGQNH
jgi:putative ABC transport system substrate-binding protein